MTYSNAALKYRVILWNHRTTRYLVFRTIADAKSYILSKPQEERTYSEVVLGWRRQKIRFDIDRCTAAQLRQILDAIRHVWRTTKRLKPLTERRGSRLLVFQSDIDGFHVLVDYFLRDAEANHIFCQDVIAELEERRQPAAAQCIDNTYAATQNLRTMFSYKYNNQTHVLGHYAKHPVTRGVTFPDSIVSEVLEHRLGTKKS